EISVGSADRGERDPGFEIGRSLKGVTDAGICAYAQTELLVGKAERGQRDRGESEHNYTKRRAVTQRGRTVVGYPHRHRVRAVGLRGCWLPGEETVRRINGSANRRACPKAHGQNVRWNVRVVRHVGHDQARTRPDGQVWDRHEFWRTVHFIDDDSKTPGVT